MQLNISGHQLDLTDALREHATNKFEKLKRHVDGITNVQLTLSVDKLIQKAEANVHGIGKEVVAHAENSDMYAAIDALVSKLDRQLLEIKERKNKHN